MRFLNLIFFVLMVLFLTPRFIFAAQIPVVNHSFESPAQASVNGWTDGVDFEGWTGTGRRGVFRASTAYIPQGIVDGVQIGWSLSGSLSQTLTTTLEANTQYILEVELLNRGDAPNISSTVQLLAGGNVLAQSVIVGGTPGTTVTQTVTFLSGASPANLGDALGITLISGGQQSDWDNVRLRTEAPSVATTLSIEQQPSNSQVNRTISPAITVALKNQYGQVVTSDTRTITLALGNNSGSATLNGTVSVAAVAGISTFNNLSVDQIADGYTLVASDGVLSNVDSDAFNITFHQVIPIVNHSFEAPAMANVNGFTSGIDFDGWSGTGSRGVFRASTTYIPQGITDGIQVGWSSGGTIAQILSATLEPNTQYVLEVDILNRVDRPNISSTLQLFAGSNVLAESVITGGTPSTTVTQTVTFLTGADHANLGDNLAISLTSGGSQADWDNVRLRAEPPSPATALIIAQQPSNSQVNRMLSPAITVALKNQFGHVVTSDTRTITLALGNNPGSATLNGTVSVAAVAGIATFNNLSVDQIADGYTLVASDGVLSNVASDAFNITFHQVIPIVNHSFELPVMANVNGSTSGIDFEGWSGTGSRGVFRASTAYIPQGISDGIQVGWSSGGTIAQILSATLEPNTQYVLEVDILNRVDRPNISSTLQLFAGSNVLAESVITGGTPSSTVTQTVTFLTGATHANLGDNLAISLTSGGSQADWDNVRLRAEPPSPATAFIIEQQPRNSQFNRTLSPAISVVLKNSYGHVVTSDTRTITLALGNNPGSATLNGTISVAAVAGVATFNNLSIDQIADGYTLVASDGVLSNVTSDAFNITFHQVIPIVNHSFELPVQASVNGYTDGVDFEGWSGLNRRGVFRASTAYIPQGIVDGLQVGWSISGTLSQTLNTTLAVNTQYVLEVELLNRGDAPNISSTIQLLAGGNVLAESIILGGIPGSTVTQTVTFLTGATHANLGDNLAINLISGGHQSDWDNVRLRAEPPGQATTLVIEQQPTDTQVDVSINPAISVVIKNPYGHTITSDTRTISLTLGSNSGSGNLNGTVSIAAIAGVATFNNLSIDALGNGYTLIVSDGVLSNVTSDSFNITTHTNIPVVNHSFELPAQASVNGWIDGVDFEGWTGTARRGVFRASTAYIPQGIVDGVQVAWSLSGTLSQTLSTKLVANTQYILEVELLNRGDAPNITSTLQLLAGGNVLADSIIVGGTPGTTVTQSVSFQTGSSHANLGDALAITLISGGQQSNWDNVRLRSTVPEPLDHFRIEHDGTGLTCESETVTIKACLDSSCTALSTDTTSLNLQINGTTVSAASFTGSTSVNFNHTTAETITLSIADPSITPPNPVVCNDGSAGSCNILYSNAGFRFLYDNSNQAIADQIAARSFTKTIQIQAVKDLSGVCSPMFSGNVAVEMSQQNLYPSGMSGLTFQVNNNDIAKVSSVNGAGTSTQLTFSAESIATIPAPIYLDAGQIRLHANYNIGGVSLAGSSNAFWVSPAKLVSNAQASGVNLNSTTATGNPTHKAGAEFDFSVTALNDAGNVTLNYQPGQIQLLVNRTGPSIGGHEGILTYGYNANSISALSATFQDVTLTNFVEGVSNYAQAKYTEVGLLTLDLQDNNYGGVGIVVPGDELNLGRFIPDHFIIETTLEGVLNGGNGFVYVGQMEDATSSVGEISYAVEPEFTITAKSYSGATTLNYTGDYMRLLKTGVSKVVPTTDATQPGVAVNSKVSLTADLQAGTLTESNGVVTYQFNNNDNFVYNHQANSLVNKFTSDIDLVITSVTDQDDVVAKDSDADPNNGILLLQPEGIDVYFARWLLVNSFGPEDSGVHIPMQIQYYKNNQFVPMLLENTQSFQSTNLTISNVDLSPGVTNASGSGSFSAGKSNALLLSAPEKRGAVSLEYQVPPWLRYDWLNADSNFDGPFDDNPTATATFGVYRSNDRIISWNEASN